MKKTRRLLSLIMAAVMLTLYMVTGVWAEDVIITDDVIGVIEPVVVEDEIIVEDIVISDEIIIDGEGADDELMPLASGSCTSVNQMQQMVYRGQAPEGIVDVHHAHTVVGQPHIHFKVGALNIDGSIHDGVAPTLTNKQRKWILENGWSVGEF